MMTDDALLTTVLKNVSRAFYLSMRVLPSGIRQPISVAYLLARAADTLADTVSVSVSQRLERLQFFRNAVMALDERSCSLARQMAEWGEGATDGERKLLQVIPQTLLLTSHLPQEDRVDVQKVVETLISGMVEDLEFFPGQFTALEELDRYTYLVAGCVGEFWSSIIARHCWALRNWDVQLYSEIGVRFGKALQLTNVLRDAVKDIQNGRCYVPGLLEDKCSWQVDSAMFYPNAVAHLRGEQLGTTFANWLELALNHYGAAIDYTVSLPWYCWRLRLAVVWPIAIGLATLAKVSRTPGWLKCGQRVKVSRSWVYRMLLLSLPISLCTPVLRSWLGSWWKCAAQGAKELRNQPQEFFL